jgi:hypothetical protein
VTLLDLITVTVFVEPIAIANAEAKVSGAGMAGHVVASVVGGLVGLTCAWALHKGSYALAARSEQSFGREEEWSFTTTLFVRTTAVLVMVLLMFLSGLLGGLAAHPLMRLFH